MGFKYEGESEGQDKQEPVAGSELPSLPSVSLVKTFPDGTSVQILSVGFDTAQVKKLFSFAIKNIELVEDKSKPNTKEELALNIG